MQSGIAPCPGEHDALGGGDARRIGGDEDVVAGRHVLDRLGDRAQVAHAVIDDGHVVIGLTRFSTGRRPRDAQPREQGNQSAPLVEGMVPAARSSGSAAMRSARAKALNTVSHWWWALSPRRLSMCTVTPA
jgi:hypothetical protein